MGDFFFNVLIYPLTQIIELAFSFCNRIFQNTGAAIIGVSAAVSVLTLPLYVVAERWQQTERDTEKKMKSEVGKINAVFKGNERYMILSTYYRQMHYHPIMQLRAAFGLLIQIPFFTAAYSYLSQLSALKGQGFLFIRDMGAPDALFSIGAFSINVLPIAMTLINMVSGFLYTKKFPLRDKIQTYALALVFLVILYNSPAGLVVYWTMNNVFSLVKNIFYKLKSPLKTAWLLACALVTIFIVWLFAGRVLSARRAILVAAAFSLVYFASLFVKAASLLADKILFDLRDNAKKRTALFFSCCAGLWLLLGFLIPTLLVSSSPMEFADIDGYGNPMYFIRNTLVQAAGLCVVWPALVYFLFNQSKKIQTILAALVFMLLVSSLLDVFVFHESYGTISQLLMFIDISSVDSAPARIIVNLISLAIACAAAVILLRFRLSNQAAVACSLAAASMLFVSLVNVRTINDGYSEYLRVSAAGGGVQNALSPIFHFSKSGKNILMIYVDKAQNYFLEPLFEECPELYGQFSGFTLYPNTTSFNAHTLLGAPACYGGYEYTPKAMNERKDETLVEKHNQALLLLPRIFSEQLESCSATVTDPTWANYRWVPDLSIYAPYPAINARLTEGNYLDYWYKQHAELSDISVTGKVLKRNILWYALFRASPLALRPAFYNSGQYWSSDTQNKNYNDFLACYSVLDYLPELTDFGAETENTFTCLTSNATHERLLLQAPDYAPVANVTNMGAAKYGEDDDIYHSFAGSMKRIGEWFDCLKENGTYDNTRIVIVADHGGNSGKENGYEWDEKFDRIRPGRYHPLLMLKDFGETGRLKLNRDFMTNGDVPALLTRGVVENARNPFTGKIINSDEKENGALVCESNMYMPHQSASRYVFTVGENEWWRVKNDIFKSQNWTQEPQR